MRWINDIIVHCTATREGKEYHVRDIDKWHKDKGWQSIGYHFVITLDGKIEQGRDINKIGAHCLGHNACSIAVCYVGGLDENYQPKDTRTPKQRAAMLSLIKRLVEKYRCPVHGHGDYAHKDCPCFDAYEEYKHLYQDICTSSRHRL